jgi:hypothetical protein
LSYFVPIDGEVADKKTLIALDGKNGLYEQLRKCKAKRKLMIVNACRNDLTVSIDMAAQKAELVDEDRDEVPEGVAALYSCQAGQRSYYDNDRKMALFFNHVNRAWKDEYAKGGPVTLEHFFEQVTVRTKTDANQTLGAKQSPLVKREYKGGWVIGKASEHDNVRTLWRREKGHWEHISRNEWMEINLGKTYRFKEVKRTRAFIELERVGVNFRVRLYDDRVEGKGANDTDFTYISKGSWDNPVAHPKVEEPTDLRTQWRRVRGRWERISGNEWIEINLDKTFRFKEAKRTTTFIELERVDVNFRIRLYDDRVEGKGPDDREFILISTGSWDKRSVKQKLDK